MLYYIILYIILISIDIPLYIMWSWRV